MRGFSVLALVALCGCEFGSAEALTIDNSCTDDKDCAQGVCDGAICVDDSGASVDIAIEVLRGASELQSALPVSWAFAPASVSGSSTRDLTLPPTRDVRGTLRWDGSRVPATLRFVRRMAGPVASLAPAPTDVDTLRQVVSGDESDGYDFDFGVALVAGETYDVTVLPSSDMVASSGQAGAPAVRSLPPLYLTLTIEDGDPAEPLRFDLGFPTDLSDECTDELDLGCTLEAAVFSVGEQGEQAEAGLQVRAIDKETSRVISSIGVTDENGVFAIRIGASASSYLIRVTASVGRTPFPSVSIDPALAFEAGPAKKRVLIPRLHPVRFMGGVRGADQVAIAGATVRFLSTGIFGGAQLGLDGSFSVSASTDEEGRFGVDVLPGLYTISVTPPSDIENSWGVLSTEALIGEGFSTVQTLVVPRQIGLQGWVTTFDEESAAGATIVARARSGGDWGARSQETVSDSLGAFMMTMDAGLYDMQVKIPSTTGYAWLIEPGLRMSADAGDVVRGYQLDPPIPLHGILRSSDGKPVPNALVRAYVLVDTELDTIRSLQVAETVSGEDGSYRLLIAPRLGGE